MSGKAMKKIRKKAQANLIAKSNGVDPVEEYSRTYKDLKKKFKKTDIHGNPKH